jgi:hypothetical protein
MSRNRDELYDRREKIVERLLDEKSYDELVDGTAKAKDAIVVSIRKQFEDTKRITNRQAAVLAGWLADEQLEYSDDEE